VAAGCSGKRLLLKGGDKFLMNMDNAVQVYALAVTAAFMFLPLAMFCNIFRNAAFNLTTYERSNRGVYPHFQGGNPFDRGWMLNLREFFGKLISALQWIFSPPPTHPPACPVPSPSTVAGLGDVNWRSKPLFTKQSLEEFYPVNFSEMQPLVFENEQVELRPAYEPSHSEVPYDGGYPPLPTDAEGTEV
jgi:hypothetical protein